MIKVRKWELTLIRMVGIPILRRLCEALKDAASRTPTKFDDALVGALEAIISWLEAEDTFEVT